MSSRDVVRNSRRCGESPEAVGASVGEVVGDVVGILVGEVVGV